MKNITVIGAGQMGNGIAHVFAQHGFQVQLVDISSDRLDSAKATISKNLDRQVAKGSLVEEEKQATLARIGLHTQLPEGVAQAEIVIEAATENVELKLEIFRQLDQHAPQGAILASNTSN